jgi:hypothetical protein
MRDSRGRFVKGSEPYNKKTGKIFTCERCGKERYFNLSEQKHGAGKFCSYACWHPKVFKECEICQLKFRIKPKEINLRHTCGSKICMQEYRELHPILYWMGKKRPEMTGKKNPKWKDNPDYDAIHAYIRRKRGIPQKCDGCGAIDNIQYANISYKYKRDLDDWKPLCPSCHIKLDRSNGYNTMSYEFDQNGHRKLKI